MDNVALDDVCKVMASENVSVDKHMTVLAVEPPQGHLADKMFANRTFF